MQTSAVGNKGHQRSGGFTLLELLVVVTLMALVSTGVAFALADNGQARMQREGERLAALLEAARAQSRASGAAVRWRADAQGYWFEGLAPRPQRGQWLEAGTQVRNAQPLWLGPEPLIGAQQVVLVNAALPGLAVRVASDGLRPFAAQPLP